MKNEKTKIPPLHTSQQFEREARQDQKGTKLAYVSITQIPEQPIDPDDGEAYTYYDQTIVLPEFWLNDADSEDVVRDGKLVVKYIVKTETTEAFGAALAFDTLKDAREQLQLCLEVDEHPDGEYDPDWIDYIVTVPLVNADEATRETAYSEEFVEGVCGEAYHGKFEAECDLYYTPSEEAD